MRFALPDAPSAEPGDDVVPGAADEPDGPVATDDEEVPFDMPGEEELPAEDRVEEAA
jgi:hypothetical protein